MSTTIKSNFNSSSNGCSLAALKKHITTCLQRWRQKYCTKRSEHHPNQPTTQKEKCSCQIQQNYNTCFVKQSSKEYTIVQHTAAYCKSVNTKFQKYIQSQQPTYKSNPTIVSNTEGPRQYGRRVEIVAKLLSSTLIARKSLVATEGKRVSFEKQTKDTESCTCSSRPNFYEDKMTVTDLTFLELREEYPDLNSEIRSILTARAQEGATISQIRDDYRKLTGITFPIYEDVTEFLLTIPHVTAYCSEKGTRIFNIMPMDKTKHILDMVMHQKPQLEPLQRPSSNNYFYRERFRNNNYQPLNWLQNRSRRLVKNEANLDQKPINDRGVEQQAQLVPSTDSNLSEDGSDGYCKNNCYYQDNCKYLFNRICNQQQQKEPLHYHHVEKARQILSKPAAIASSNIETEMSLKDFKHDVPSYKNNLNHLNNLYQVQHQQQHEYQQNSNNMKATDMRRFSFNPCKTTMPTSSRCSSPIPKSWYTNESAYTESDYEAHILDFLLLGDDFFLYMARMELRCKFKKHQRVLESGLCVSGQTIAASIKRIKSLTDQRRSIILNIGSVDIMKGRQLIEIEYDFRELILTMLNKGMNPILTTLAPLANYNHNNELKHRLERFNDFIKREAQKMNLVVVDIWRCLVNEKGHVHFDCYQNEPRSVTGTSESYLFWNKIGRQRVLQLIESKLEY